MIIEDRLNLLFALESKLWKIKILTTSKSLQLRCKCD